MKIPWMRHRPASCTATWRHALSAATCKQLLVRLKTACAGRPRSSLPRVSLCAGRVNWSSSAAGCTSVKSGWGSPSDWAVRLSCLGCWRSCYGRCSTRWMRSAGPIVYQLYLGLLYFRQVADTFAILAKALAPALPLVFSIVALGLLTQAGVLWVVSYRYITNPRRIVI